MSTATTLTTNHEPSNADIMQALLGLRHDMDRRFDEMKVYTDKRFDDMKLYVDTRFDEMETYVDARFDQAFSDMKVYVDIRFDQMKAYTDSRFDQLSEDVGNIASFIMQQAADQEVVAELGRIVHRHEYDILHLKQQAGIV